MYMLVSLLLRSLLLEITEPEIWHHMSGSSRMANSGHNLNTNPKVPALWVPAGSNISGDMQCVEVIGMVAKTYISVLNIPFFSVK